MRWADVPHLSALVSRCLAAWQQYWQQSQGSWTDSRPSTHYGTSCAILGFVGINSRVVTLVLLTLAVAVGLSFIAGAWAGVGLTLAALVSTALWEITRERQKQNAAEAKRRETALTTFAPTAAVASADVEALVERGAAWYLRPEAEVVAFWSRPELDELRQWCVNGGHLAVRLVSGDGGAGKTRLAVQLSRDLAEDGWRTMWVPPGGEAAAVDAVRDIGEPAVLVVDYAETRPGLAGLLAEAIAAVDGPDLRVALLARSAGEWWQQLLNGAEYELSQVLEAAAPIVLGPLSTGGGQQDIFDEAVTAFADRLEVSRPDATLGLTDPNAVVLVVHAAALLAVLDHASTDGGSGRPRTASEILAGLLAHEARYWHKSAVARGLIVDPSVERLAVALGCLIGADNETDAIGMLARVPDLADSAERRGQVARWLHDLYPRTRASDDAEDEDWIGSLRPDRVAEQLVVGELSGRSGLLPGLLVGLSDHRKLRALTVLGRAAVTDPRAVGLLRGALNAGLDDLAIPALTVTIETNLVIADLLYDALTIRPVSDQTLKDIAAALPHPTFALAETAVAVLQRLVDQSASDSVQRAAWLIDLTGHLWGLGRREEALAASEEAVGICRGLGQDPPNAVLAELATALTNQSNCLSGLGRREGALAASEEAVGIYQRLADSDPAKFLPNLAMTLNNQSSRLWELRRPEDALAAIEEAGLIYQRLAEADPTRLPDLASALHNQSIYLSALGLHEEALTAIEKAVAIRRDLAQILPDAFLPDLAMSLNNKSNRLATLERWEEALAVIEEAVAIRRDLARARPDAFLPGLAGAVNNQSHILRGLGKTEEALTASEEAVRIYRRLAKNHPDAFLPHLARTLVLRSLCLADDGQRKEALAASEEAVRIYRRLANDFPDVFLLDLAGALNNHADRLSALARNREADAARREAIAIQRDHE